MVNLERYVPLYVTIFSPSIVTGPEFLRTEVFPSSVFQYCCLSFKHACYLFTSMDHGTAIQVRFRNRLGIRKYPARYSYRSCLVNRTFDGWHPASRKVPPAVYCFSILLLSHHARSISQHLCMFIFWTRVQDKASRKALKYFPCCTSDLGVF